MSDVIGYARVSTLEQNVALQVDALAAAGAVRVFTDYASGAADGRPELAKAIAYLNPGDTVAVWRIDRLSRSPPRPVRPRSTTPAGAARAT